MSDGCGFDESVSAPEADVPDLTSRPTCEVEEEAARVKREDAWRVAQLAAVVMAPTLQWAHERLISGGGWFSKRTTAEEFDRTVDRLRGYALIQARALLAEAEGGDTPGSAP